MNNKKGKKIKKKRRSNMANPKETWRDREITHVDQEGYQWSDGDSTIKLTPSSVINIQGRQYQEWDSVIRMTTPDRDPI